MRRKLLLWASLCLGLLLVGGTSGARAEVTAHFVVDDRVINPDLQPFTATISAIGNGHRLSGASGFEPRVHRTLHFATGGTTNRIDIPGWSLTMWDAWKNGALDGAEIEVLRIEDGAFRSIRSDVIPRGGFVASGWTVLEKGRAISPDQTRYVFAWDRWNRPEADYHFTVRAVDAQGNESGSASFVTAVMPREATRSKETKPEAALTDIRASGAESSLAAPGNLKARLTPQGMAELTWDPVPGASGYILYKSDLPPDQHEGHFVRLGSDGPKVLPGDLIILRHKFHQSDRDRLLTNRVWGVNNKAFKRRMLPPFVERWPDELPGGGWALVPHEPGTAVTEPGETFLRVDLQRGQELRLAIANHSGADQYWYEVLEPGQTYRYEFWARGQAVPRMQFSVGSPTAVPRNFTHPVTIQWTRYTGTFRASRLDPGKKPQPMTLLLSGPGRFEIDNLRIYRDDVPFLALRPEDADRLRTSGMGGLRTHSLIKTNTRTYDLAELTNPGGVSNIVGGNTLPQLLSVIDSVDMAPWIQIEPHLSRQEWLGLAEFLAAPFDPDQHHALGRPWASKRYYQGQKDPWIDRFEKIYFEIGNETWNPIFRPWTFEKMKDSVTGRAYSRGEAYGLYQEYVLGILRQSPYWSELSDRLVPVLGGWARLAAYGTDAAAMSPNSPLLTHASYNGGWDENEGPVSPTPRAFASALTNVLQTTLPRGKSYRDRLPELEQIRGTPLALGTYEGGPGYALRGTDKKGLSPEATIEQEQTMKSVAAGTATLDTFLAQAELGFVIQNYFSYAPGRMFSSHGHWHKGGHTFPAWDMLGLFNREALGDMLSVEDLRVPTIDLPESKRREKVRDGPLVATYATRKDDRLSVIVISRQIPGFPDKGSDGRTAVTIDLPISAADGLTLHRMNGAYDAHNFDMLGAKLVAEDLPVPDSLPRLEISELPPGAALMFVFDGVR